MRFFRHQSGTTLKVAFLAVSISGSLSAAAQNYQQEAEAIASMSKGVTAVTSTSSTPQDYRQQAEALADMSKRSTETAPERRNFQENSNQNIEKYNELIGNSKPQGVMNSDTNKGYVPSMQADSVQAVINQTRAIRESSETTALAEEISRRRDVIQSDANVNQLAEVTVESKQSLMRSQSTNIEKMFGSAGITASDWERKLDDNRNQELSSETGLTIFTSFSMPDYLFEDILKVAAEHNARVVLNGLKVETTRLTETQAAIKQYVLKAKLKKEPLITIDPEAFAKYQVTQVPTMVYRTEQKFAKISGSYNIDHFEREIAEHPERDIFPTIGTTFQVEEKSLIKELEERAQNYDWEGAKKRALNDTWKNQWMVTLPVASTHKEWLIDPTIRVTQDVQDRQGRTLAYAGEMINPLRKFPQKITMIIFDAMNPEQTDWAAEQYKTLLGSGHLMPMFTRIDKNNGWDALNDLRNKFNGKVFKANEQIISRFHIKATPAVIRTDNDKFRVTQFSEAEVKGIGEQQTSSEK